MRLLWKKPKFKCNICGTKLFESDKVKTFSKEIVDTFLAVGAFPRIIGDPIIHETTPSWVACINCYNKLKNLRGEILDGRVFRTAKIALLEWMCEDLRVTEFQNGDPIYIARDKSEWREASTNAKPACFRVFKRFENDKIIECILYNFYAVTDKRRIAPKGWKIPSDYDWGSLFWETELEVTGVLRPIKDVHNCSDSYLKSAHFSGYLDWSKPENRELLRRYINIDHTDNIGFSAKPNGYISSIGEIKNIGYACYYWCLTMSVLEEELSAEKKNNQAKYYRMSVDSWSRATGYFDKGAGISVRCIKNIKDS